MFTILYGLEGSGHFRYSNNHIMFLISVILFCPTYKSFNLTQRFQFIYSRFSNGSSNGPCSRYHTTQKDQTIHSNMHKISFKYRHPLFIPLINFSLSLHSYKKNARYQSYFKSKSKYQFHYIYVVLPRVADPEGVDPDPDPTSKITTDPVVNN